MNILISYKNGIVTSIISKDSDLIWIKVDIGGEIFRAVNYTNITGDVDIGDSLVLNTTAVELSLGTGGYHFVMYNHSNPSRDLEGEGHIMKLRYSPYQIRCMTAEEQDSQHHDKFKKFKSLDKHIFVVATLHSMLAPISAMIKYLNPDIKINYLMTDGGALPINFSRTIKELKEKNIINKTITTGHSFGGDLECTNIYTGLIAAKEVLKGDITIISMGPGIVGTGTKYGFTGIEQGNNINAINSLGGMPIVVPRISFNDARPRHRGISHHTLTVISEIVNEKSTLILPILEGKEADYINKQIEEFNIKDKHDIIMEDGKKIKEALGFFEIKTTTMGRGINQDLEYFIALGAVGNHVIKLLK